MGAVENRLFSLFDRPLDFAAGFAGFDGFTPVVQLLAFRQAELHFGMAASGKIDAEGNEGQSFELRLADQLVDFLFVQQ